jgi:hypothetical protein
MKSEILATHISLNYMVSDYKPKILVGQAYAVLLLTSGAFLNLLNWYGVGPSDE